MTTRTWWYHTGIHGRSRPAKVHIYQSDSPQPHFKLTPLCGKYGSSQRAGLTHKVGAFNLHQPTCEACLQAVRGTDWATSYKPWPRKLEIEYDPEE